MVDIYTKVSTIFIYMKLKEFLDTKDIAKKDVYLKGIAKEKLKGRQITKDISSDDFLRNSLKNLDINDISWVENDRQTPASGGGNYYALFPENIMSMILDYVESKEYIRNPAVWEFAINVDDRDNLNRLHIDGIPPEFVGLGLGFKMYKSLINYIGYASSADNATTDAQKVWLKLLNDEDFNSVLIKDRVLIMKKDLSNTIKKRIIGTFINDYFPNVSLKRNKLNTSKDILIDTDLLDIISDIKNNG